MISIISTTAWSESIPLVPVNDAGFSISAGGEWREKYENTDNKNWSAVPKPDRRLLHRLGLNLDTHFNSSTRFFFELKSSTISENSYPTRPVIDEDKLDLNQFFIDQVFSIHLLRVGRQELEYGSGRLVAVRDGTNVRAAFDGLKIVTKMANWQWNNFWLMPVPTIPDVFDDHPSVHQQFWGSYAVYSGLENMEIAPYYFGYRDDFAKFGKETAAELRHTLGLRLNTKPDAKWNYDVEGAYQFGTYGKKTISAWMAGATTGYSLDSLPLRPKLMLKTWVASGDRDPGDDRLNTFNTLFVKRNLIDASFALGGTNLINLEPYVNLSPVKPVTVTLGYNSFWRQSIQDGIYNPGGIQVRTASNSTNHFVGAGFRGAVVWKVCENFKLSSHYVHISAGEYIRDAGGTRDIDYVSVVSHLVF